MVAPSSNMASNSKPEPSKIQELLFKCPFDAKHPLLSTKLICPIEILTCNGISPTNFCEARLDLQFNRGVFLCAFFREQWLWPYRVLASEVKDESGVAENLKNFFMNKKHGECLKNLQYMKKESDIQAILSAHLFGPLSSSCWINKNHVEKDLKACPGCNEDVSLGDTSFGNMEVWYGEADIIVHRSAVKVDTIDDSSKQKSNNTVEENIGESDEPAEERQRLNSNENASDATDDSVSFSEDLDYTFKTCRWRQSSQNNSEEKQEQVCYQTSYQSLAQTITNAFLQVKKSPELRDIFIPSFMATKKFIRIHMYNCSNDLLFVSEDLPLFDPSTGELNVSTIIYLWLSLNTDVPARNMGLLENNQSKFRDFVKKYDKCSCYTDGVSQHLKFHDKEIHKPVFEASPLFQWSDFDRYVTKAKQIYNNANSHFYGEK